MCNSLRGSEWCDRVRKPPRLSWTSARTVRVLRGSRPSRYSKPSSIRAAADTVRGQLISRNCNRIKRYQKVLDLLPQGYVFDGEVVLDDADRPLFNKLLCEGIVAKKLTDPYNPKSTRWHKILNRDSQRPGHTEWFRERHHARGREQTL